MRALSLRLVSDPAAAPAAEWRPIDDGGPLAAVAEEPWTLAPERLARVNDRQELAPSANHDLDVVLMARRQETRP
jgi:hypothetical protein